ncbi:CotH kinase family protein [Mobilitalea sibirica]|uniref:CotH kinase family protein n=1 Tax=Mobilitalea sibirica TaxID=1462919 RepID=A0A8J7H4I0_9FIRM|nr:CotH kinase family protein [Mobilitalea sibirica]MBH1942373.1 CotH kinase family protein [Mobilitalea sibirica]
MLKKKKYLTLFIMLSLIFLLPVKVGAETIISEPTFSVPAGLYTEEFDLTITSDVEDASIYYTIDGSVPSVGNATTYPYANPIKISNTPLREKPSPFFSGTVIRAIVVGPEGSISKTATASYFVDNNIFNRYSMPIISITTDNANLYDNSIGIMAPSNTKNRGKEWERPIHFEYFDKDGNLQLSQDAGIRLHGGASRDWAFKSLRIYARSEYDEQTQFEYDFFSSSVIPALVNSGEKQDDIITKFKRLLLRAGGNEGTAGDATFFRDALSQALMTNTKLDLQAYSPAVTFINGEFYGIHNIRERQDDKYIEDHYDIDENEVVIYEFTYEEGTGKQQPVISSGSESDLEFYNTLLEFITKNDLSKKENYEQVQQWLDIENFVDYQIINIYGANRDWPGNNCKAWRVRTEYNPEAAYGLDGRLRYLVYDMDFNFGLYNMRAVNMNSLADATKAGGTEWPNQDGSTLFLRKLLENEEFQTYFNQRFLDLLNTNFDKDSVITLIDQISGYYSNGAIEEQKTRYFLLHDWHRNIEAVKMFIDKRPAIVKSHLAGKFKLGKMYFLSIGVANETNPLGGKIQINTITIDGNSKGVINGVWKKSYYEKLPTLLTAIPDEGYEFVSWSGASDSTEPTIDASMLYNDSGDVNLTPIFRLISANGEETKESATTDYENDNIDEALDTKDEQKQSNQNNNSTFYIISLIIITALFILVVVSYVRQNRKNNHS